MPTQTAPSPNVVSAPTPTAAHTVNRAVLAGRERYGDLSPDLDFLESALWRLPRRTAASASPERIAELYLAAACEQGLSGAWDALWNCHLRSLAPVAVRAGLSFRDAQEVVVELFSELWIATSRKECPRGLIGFLGRGSLDKWLGQIIRRRAYRWLRRRLKTQPDFELDSLTSSPRNCDLLTQVAEEETKTVALEAIRRKRDRLSPREATVVTLKYEAGLSQSAIARELRIGEPRVSRIHRRALTKLQSPHSLAI